MMISRREFVVQAGIVSAVVPALVRGREAAAAPPPLRIGMTDWNLGKRGDITKIALAREIGLDGIQVSLTFPTDGSPHLREPKTQAAFKQAALDQGIQICSLAIGSPGKSRLPLHTNPAAAILLVEAVEVARNLGTTNILLPILGDSHIHMDNQQEVDTFVAMMKEVARYAEQAGVVVAIEDWLSADDNLRLLDAIGSDAVGVYYDARNIKSRRARSLWRAGTPRQAHQPGPHQERPEADAGHRHPRLAAPRAGVRRHRLSRLVRARDRLAVERPDRRHARQHRVREKDVQDSGVRSGGNEEERRGLRQLRSLPGRTA